MINDKTFAVLSLEGYEHINLFNRVQRLPLVIIAGFMDSEVIQELKKLELYQQYQHSDLSGTVLFVRLI